jgi:hypothetical protein
MRNALGVHKEKIGLEVHLLEHSTHGWPLTIGEQTGDVGEIDYYARLVVLLTYWHTGVRSPPSDRNRRAVALSVGNADGKCARNACQVKTMEINLFSEHSLLVFRRLPIGGPRISVFGSKDHAVSP